MSLVTKAFGGVTDPESDWAAEDAEFGAQFPTLHAFLTSREVIGGKRRTPSTVTFVAEDGVFKAGIRDRDRQCSLWVSATSVAGLWAALEKGLTATPVEWRHVADDKSRNRPKP